MQLTEDQNESTYQIQSINDQGVVINNTLYSKSLIIAPNRLLLDWGPTNIQSLTDAYLLQLIETKPEIILLGTGKTSHILSAEKLAVLLKRQYPIECMSTSAACRTYTILSSENRRVVAGLVI